MKASFNVVNAVAAPAFKVYEFAQGHRSSQEKIVTAQSHPSVIHCPCKFQTKDETMMGSFKEKKGSVLKRSQRVYGLGVGGYKLAAKLCHKASQSPPAAKPLLTRLSNFRPSFRPARLSMAIPKKSHFEQKVGIVANLLYPN